MLLVALVACSAKSKTAEDARVAVAPLADAAVVMAADAAAVKAADRFARPALEDAERRALLHKLRGEWVNHTGLESIRWTFKGEQLTEQVTRRGVKGDKGRRRSLTVGLPQRNRMTLTGQAGRVRSYQILVRPKALYASETYGIFPMKGPRHFLVHDSAGNNLEYKNGECTVSTPGKAPEPVRCLYKVSYYHKVLTFRYRSLASGEPMITIFHGEGGFLMHEKVISCCKFNLLRR